MSNYKKNYHPFKGSILHHALRHIEDGIAKQEQDAALETLRQSISKTRNIHCSDFISKPVTEMLHRHGIILAILPVDFKEYRIGSLSQSFIGIGVKNAEGSICFYTDTLGHAITIGKTSYTYLPIEKQQKTEECIVFFDFLDYLSYLTVMTHSKGSVGKPEFDIIILNDLKNITLSQELVLSYKKINTFLPRGESYDAIINTFQHLSDNRVSDCSWFYQKKDFDTFMEFCEATFGNKSQAGGIQ